ncbi:MAG: M48 family metallopeptidase [Woeseia sp.]|nr:M48 family metallopeptidase [Woeseia sp.]
MNFFEAQDSARRATRGLVIAYSVATLLIVAGVTAIVGMALYGTQQNPDPAILLAAAIATIALIVSATLYKTARLSSGGGTVARDLGGTQVPPDVNDPLRRRLRNVVEEMSIASGIPVPEIYVLEQETGINAFAAGFTTGDAAIAVTRGTLEILNRDELQGVIAHEFSHILNGDMRLNIRMMGVLFGIMVLGLIGRFILRSSYRTGLSSSRSRRGSGGGAPVLLIGVGLIVVGSVGVFMSRLIKAAVSRQREYLADASAVQFTRQTDGIANALKKIGGYQRHSYLKAADPEEVSHMLFALGARFSGLFATHPPLIDRIKALQPGFRDDDLPTVDLPRMSPSDGDAAFSNLSQFTAGGDALQQKPIIDTIGNPTLQHVMYAGALRGGLPETLYEAAHSPHLAPLLVFGIFISGSQQRSASALEFLARQLGEQRAKLVSELHDALAAGGPEWRLPLLEIAFPTLRQMPLQRIEFMLDIGQRLIEQDGQIELHEFCLYRILKLNLGNALAPSARSRPAAKAEVRSAALILLAVIALNGQAAAENRERAFAAGVAKLGKWAKDATLQVPADRVAALRDCLDTLQRVSHSGRQKLVQAVAAVISEDGRLTAGEAELLRAVCASLLCPLPPLAVRRDGQQP